MGLEDISRFVNSIGDQVNLTFKAIDDFIDFIITGFSSIGVWLNIVIFIALFLLLLMSPIYIVKYYDKIRIGFTSIFKRMFRSKKKKVIRKTTKIVKKVFK